jgi:Cu+-exporting ATPase
MRPREGGRIMAKDPVCKMDVDEAKAEHTSTHKGKTYYFCSAGCKKSFDQSPDKYVKKQ